MTYSAVKRRTYDHKFLVGVDDSYLDAPGVRRTQRCILRIALLVEFDSKESQPIANPGADRGRVLTDAASKNQRVDSAQRRRECADPFLDLVAKSVTRLLNLGSIRET
jgi:hypothetical protein